VLTKEQRAAMRRKYRPANAVCYSAFEQDLVRDLFAALADLDAAYEALQDIHDMADDGAQSPNRAVLMDIVRRAAEALGGE